MRALERIDLGRIRYQDALDRQHREVERLRGPEGASLPDLLLCCEHEEVVTTGRRAQLPERGPAELAAVRAAGVQVLEVERGGAATWHGPGQLVGYPIVRLAEGERDLHRVLRAIEQALIDGVGAVTGLALERREGLTGAWCQGKKIASIGIACRGWVTYHGFALNLDADLSRLRLFRPCDLESQSYGSLASLGVSADRDALAAAIHAALARELQRA